MVGSAVEFKQKLKEIRGDVAYDYFWPFDTPTFSSVLDVKTVQFQEIVFQNTFLQSPPLFGLGAYL